jgi:hypothetical protein
LRGGLRLDKGNKAGRISQQTSLKCPRTHLGYAILYSNVFLLKMGDVATPPLAVGSRNVKSLLSGGWSRMSEGHEWEGLI